MKTLLVVPWDEEFGGVVSVAGHLGRYLQSRGHDVVFFHPGRRILSLEEHTTKWGFRGFKLGLGMPLAARHSVLNAIALCGLFPFRLYQIVRLIRRQRIQIINVHYPMPSGIYFALCRWILPVRLVTSVHGADVVRRRRSRAKYLHAIRFLLFSSDLVVANSRAFRQQFLDLYPHLHGRTIFIHNGVDLVELSGSGRDEDGVRVDRYILCVAGQSVHKGVDVLIEALARLDGVNPPVSLVLVGDGPGRSRFEELARSLGVHERVEFLGWKRRPEVVKLLHGCEAFVLPSRSEPLGIAIIEALACRKAVVASATGGIPEIIESGKNGILVEPESPGALAEAIMAVLGNPDLRRTLSENGYSTVERRFRYEHTGAAYEAAFGGLDP